MGSDSPSARMSGLVGIAGTLLSGALDGEVAALVAADRIKVHGTGAHGGHQVHQGAQFDDVTGFREGLAELDAAVRVAHVREKVHGVRELVALDAPLAQRLEEVVRAAAMTRDPEVVLVAPRVAGRDEHVVTPRVVQHDLDHGAAAVGPELVAGGREQAPQGNEAVDGAERLGQVVGVVGDEIGDLPPLDVDDAEGLAGPEGDGPAGRGGNADRRHRGLLSCRAGYPRARKSSAVSAWTRTVSR